MKKVRNFSENNKYKVYPKSSVKVEREINLAREAPKASAPLSAIPLLLLFEKEISKIIIWK